MTENDARKYVRDFLNGTDTKQELMNRFDLVKCSTCPSIELEEDLVNHKGDMGDLENKICEDCRNNE